ncbi:MAG: type I methionyl aminopeptidase [Parcubacteria group bacterium]|nr:type I methionyl aminopeptidase [Parcubacteria group bacterium]
MIIIKTKEEIGLIREGGKILAIIMDELEDMVVAGIKTIDIDKKAAQLADKYSAKPSFRGYRGFPASVCTSVNDKVVHSVPQNESLKDGDIIGIDFGLLYKKHFTDMARTIAVGDISEELKKLIKVTKESLNLGIDQIKLGNKIGDISYAIQTHVESNNLSVVRELVGHGVGKKVHEDPQIPNFGAKGKGPVLKSGMVVAIEPMVNMGSYEIKLLDDGWSFATKDGSMSAHFEHTVVVTDDGYEILTI